MHHYAGYGNQDTLPYNENIEKEYQKLHVKKSRARLRKESDHIER